MIEPNYIFKNQHIKNIPPPRTYHPINHTGVSTKNIHYKITLESIPRVEFKKHLHNALDVPKRLGDWDLMNEWIENMWEALYNPIWIYKNPNGKLGVMHGHHRFRLLDAMRSNVVWAYMLTADRSKIGNLQIPVETKNLMTQNDVAPIKGTVSGVCESCGQHQRWVRKTFNRVNDVRMYCRICGEENPYPWRGQI